MILLDSSFLVAYHNTRDAHHDAATEVMARFLADEWGTGLLLEYVFLEVTTVLALRVDADVAWRVGDALLSARELEFVPCSPVFLDAYEEFRRQKGSPLSFVDSAILAVAKTRGVTSVATFDGGFRGIDGIVTVPG